MMADDTKPEGTIPSAPATGANEAATPHATPRPAARPADPRLPAAPASDLAGKTTSPASTAVGSTRDPDDTSPLLSRRAWIGLSWGAFSAASTVALGATGRFMFPNVLNEPPQQFKAGFPNEYGMGVDERWKEKFGIWIVRTPEDPEQQASGIYALIAVCTHLGCTPKPHTPHVAGNTALARVA